jgi:hypothetical protein
VFRQQNSLDGDKSNCPELKGVSDMKTGLIVSAVLALVGGSTAAACELAVEQPIVVNASQGWSSVPTTTTCRPVTIGTPPQYGPVTIGKPVQYRARPNAAPVYTPLPAPVYVPTTTYRPLVPIAQMPSQYRFGRGILGQPKVYVSGQPIRNFLRYLSL